MWNPRVAAGRTVKLEMVGAPVAVAVTVILSSWTLAVPCPGVEEIVSVADTLMMGSRGMEMGCQMLVACSRTDRAVGAL